MATLEELAQLYNNSELIKKISAALIIRAKATLDNVATATAAEKAWAVRIFTNPHNEAHRVLRAMLAENNAASVAQITGANDAAIQGNVNTAVQLFIDADAGA